MISTAKMLLTLSALVLTPLLLSTLIASAQSFNCAKAKSSAQFAICNNEDLLSMDEKLAVLFDQQKSKQNTIPRRVKFTRDHSKWIKQREKCDLDWDCLKTRYDERIHQLAEAGSG